MSNIYSNQPFNIQLSYTELPPDIVSQQVCYKNPNGILGHFNALLDTINKIVYYNSQIGETLGISGSWEFWSKLIDSNNQEYPGDPITITVFTEGNPGSIVYVKDTGLDHLYPNGVPIVILEIVIADIYKLAARMSSLTVQADPYFNNHTAAQKLFSELHGEGDRITGDFLEKGARDISPVFSAFQRWMVLPTVSFPEIFEYNNSGKIIFRWLNLDTRQEHTLDYTSKMYDEICMDANAYEKIKKYLTDALVDFLLKELYRAIGYDKKYTDYFRSYEQNRQYVAYWLKNDRSTKTQYHYAGV